MRRGPLTPIFDYEPRRGSITVGNTPGTDPPPTLIGVNHWWDTSNDGSLTKSGGGTAISEIADLIGATDLLAPNDDPPITTINGHQCSESYEERGTTANRLAVFLPGAGEEDLPDIAEPCTFSIVGARRNSGLAGGPANWGTGVLFDTRIATDTSYGFLIRFGNEGTNANVNFAQAGVGTTTLRTATFEEILAIVVVLDGASSTVHVNGVLEHTFTSSGNGIDGLTIFNTYDFNDGNDLYFCEAQTSDEAEADPAAFSTKLQTKWS